MKKSILLLTNIAVVAFASCGTLAEKNNEVSAVSFSETNIAADGSEDSAYTYTIQDVHNLQDFLLTRSTEEAIAGKPYDMNNDGSLDAFDLCLMRRTLQKKMKLKISVNGTDLSATLADSTAAKELAEKLKAEPVTIKLNEYGGFEKVGKLPWSLTKSDESIVTEAGDIMLYQGDQMTIFYNSNSWSYTKLGHIDNITGEELEDLFGEGNITVTLSY
ncbi:MAG: hypothetical protein II729_08725 [Ruminococcus sp.]|nr:hypothetical protein [Ruminococcus sp.]